MRLFGIAPILGRGADTEIVPLVVQTVQVSMINERRTARRKTENEAMHPCAVRADGVVRSFSFVFLDVPLVLIEPLKINIIDQGGKTLCQFNCFDFPFLRTEAGRRDCVYFPF
jgi:hypothetical protein